MQHEEATTESAIEGLWDFVRTHIIEVHCVATCTPSKEAGLRWKRHWQGLRKCKDSSPVAAQDAFQVERTSVRDGSPVGNRILCLSALHL